MGCDMHLAVFERAVARHPDRASMSARLVAMMLSKRAAQEQTDSNGSGATQLWLILTEECWEHVAKACQVTFRIEWVPCPFGEWLDLSSQDFPVAYQRFETARAAVMQNVPAEDFDPFDDEQARSIENLILAKTNVGSTRKVGTSWQDDFGVFGARNYDAFGLFSPGVGSYRSSYLLKIKTLGCMRDGWPADISTHAQWCNFNSGFYMESGRVMILSLHNVPSLCGSI